MTRMLVMLVALLVLGIQACAVIAVRMLLSLLGVSDVDEPLRDDR